MSKARKVQKFVCRINLVAEDDSTSPTPGKSHTEIFLPVVPGRITGMQWELKLTSILQNVYLVMGNPTKWAYGNLIYWLLYRERRGSAAPLVYPRFTNGDQVMDDAEDMVYTGQLSVASGSVEPTVMVPTDLVFSTPTVASMNYSASHSMNQLSVPVAAPAGTGTLGPIAMTGSVTGTLDTFGWGTEYKYGDTGGTTVDTCKGKSKGIRKMKPGRDLIRFTVLWYHHAIGLSPGQVLTGYVTIYYET